MHHAPSPEALRPHYSSFLSTPRVLLTGHSHQAWPDVAEQGLRESFRDAAADVDDKWRRALERAERVRRGVADRLGVTAAQVALGASTHDLVVRLLSALDLRARPRLVTTTGEFHSLHRQLSRLEEAGVEVVWVEAAPAATLGERLADSLDERTAAVLASSVLFETSALVPHLGELATRARALGVTVLIDAYHAFGVVPFRHDELGPDVYVVAGGYKYAQWGEGVCFLVTPREVTLRPVVTGWFSDFEHLDRRRDGGAVRYGARPAERFAGSTYDPASHYRAARVLDFFDELGLDVGTLRRISIRQTERLLGWLDHHGLGERVVTPRDTAARGGFVALRVARAADVARRLQERRVHTDARGDLLRLGPAPYVTDHELEAAASALAEVVPRGGED